MTSEKVKEIKKALEHCAVHDCSDSCVFSDKHPFACLTELHKQLLNYINELESENERLSECYKVKAYDKLRAENKKLKDRIAELEKGRTQQCIDCIEWRGANEKLKEFAERLKENFAYDIERCKKVDETLKEFLGETK